MYTPPQCVVTQYHSMSHMALRIVSFSMLIPLSKKPKTTRVSRDASDSRPDVTMEIGPSRSTPSLRAVMYRSLARFSAFPAAVRISRHLVTKGSRCSSNAYGTFAVKSAPGLEATTNLIAPDRESRRA